MAREYANQPVDDEPRELARGDELRELARDDELREFARDDEGPAPADRAFQETLRERLWRLLRGRAGKGENEPLD